MKYWAKYLLYRPQYAEMNITAGDSRVEVKGPGSEVARTEVPTVLPYELMMREMRAHLIQGIFFYRYVHTHISK
jgi:hypothetical protein